MKILKSSTQKENGKPLSYGPQKSKGMFLRWRRTTINSVALFILLLPLTQSVRADFDAGLAAYEHGDYKTALQEFRQLAEQGQAAAQHKLGVMYTKGEGVPQDDAEAMQWYRRAADQGFAKAQFNLGAMYASGKGAPQDEAEAVVWFRRAAEQGQGPMIVRELGGLNREITKAANVVWTCPPSGHDDMAISAAMGVWAQHYRPARVLIDPSRLVRRRTSLKPKARVSAAGWT
jgi:hypothetical protein